MADQRWRRRVPNFVEAFPDLRLAVENILAEGDMGVARIALYGIHTGGLPGRPADQQAGPSQAIELDRMVDCEVAERWLERDQLGLVQQWSVFVIPGPRLLVRMLAHQAKKLRSRLPAKRSR